MKSNGKCRLMGRIITLFVPAVLSVTSARSETALVVGRHGKWERQAVRTVDQLEGFADV